MVPSLELMAYKSTFTDANWSMVIVNANPNPKKAEKLTSSARIHREPPHPYTFVDAYITFMMEEGDERIRAAYDGSYERLTPIKARYEPAILFQHKPEQYTEVLI